MTRRSLQSPASASRREAPSAEFAAAFEAIRGVERDWPLWDEAAMEEALASCDSDQLRALADTFESMSEAQWAALHRWFAAPIVGDGWPTIDDFGLCVQVQQLVLLVSDRSAD